MGYLGKLKIPVNPDYNWDKAPEEQAEYANPVTLNNRIVELANATITVAEAIMVLQRQRGVCRSALKAAQDALEDFEQDLLVKYPPSTSATKSNRLVTTYIRTVAFQHGLQDQYRELRDRVRELELEDITLHTRLESLKTAQQGIESITVNIQTHLSYVKAERQHGRFA